MACILRYNRESKHIKLTEISCRVYDYTTCSKKPIFPIMVVGINEILDKKKRA